MSTTRRQFFRLTALSAGLMASGVALANASIDPLLDAQMRKARPTQAMQVIVTFKQKTPVSAQQIAALKTLGITKGVYMQRLPIMGVMATPAQVRQLAKRKDVVSVYYNARLRYMNLEQRQMSGSARVSTSPGDFGRAIPYSGRGVTVVVNDSGVDTTHPDLPMGSKVQDNVFAAQNFLANTSGIVPYTVVRGVPNSDLGSGHGQHCAGTIAGTGTASGGKYRGAAPGADLVGYGSGGVLLILDAVGGLDFALANQFSYRHPIRVVSNSWGTNGKFNPAHPVITSTYLLAQSGIVSVFAAGNDGPGENTHNPYAQAPWVVSVGAGEKDGVLTSFSSRGNRGESGEFTMEVDGSTHTYKNEPTIVATGVDIVSTRTLTGGVLATSAPQDAGLAPGHVPYYSHLSGTSMATPHVAGVVALMFEANPNLSPADVKRILQRTATNMSGRRTFEVGSGHVNAYAAVAMAQSMAQNRTIAYGNTLKTNRSFKTLTSAGNTVDLMNRVELVVPQATSNEFEFEVKAEQKLIELTGKVDAYASTNGTGTAYVRAVLVEPDGVTTHRATSSTLPGAFLLGPVTQVTVPNPKPGTWKLRVDGAQTNGQAVFTPEEMILSAFGRASGAASGPADVLNLPEAERKLIGDALAAELIDADDNGNFNPGRTITRFDLAQALVFGANIRQSLPLRTSTSRFTAEFNTNTAAVAQAKAAFVEAVTARGAVLRDLTYTQQPVMKLTGTTFSPNRDATREEVAYSLVQALGDQAETDRVVLGMNGAITTADGKLVEDFAQIDASVRKHVKRALDLGMLGLSTVNGKHFFNPAGQVTKLDLAGALLKYNTEYRKVEDE